LWRADSFWQTVEENLRRGQVRLIFVADQAPRELLRLTEFLNEQMRDTEVLLVEIKQFCAQDGQKAIVPRLLGRPERTRRFPLQGQQACTPTLRRHPRTLGRDDLRRRVGKVAQGLPADRGIGVEQPVENGHEAESSNVGVDLKPKVAA
jgi:hypothetical protein